MSDSTLRDLLAGWLPNIARLVLRDLPLESGDEEDLVQEVILRFMDSSSMRQALDRAVSPRLYVARTVRNAGLDLLRKRARQRRLRATRELIATDDIDRLHRELDSHRVAAILQELPSEDRELLRLRFWEDATLKEIAEQYGITVSTVYYRLSRILESLRQDLDKKK